MPRGPVLRPGAGGQLRRRYCGVRPAPLRVWRLRYGLTPCRSRSGANLYVLDELAEVLARRAGEDAA